MNRRADSVKTTVLKANRGASAKPKAHAKAGASKAMKAVTTKPELVKPPHPSNLQVPSCVPWSSRRSVVYASDCSGLDGGAVALKRLRCFQHLFGSEIDPKYRTVFQSMHPDCKEVFPDAMTRDLTPFAQQRQLDDTKALIYTAGFPCQPYSKDGCRLGDSDARAGVVWAVCLAIEELRPDVYVLENVAELVESHKFTEIASEILRVLCEIGGGLYMVDFKVLDSKNYGVPAARRRVYFVGVRRDRMIKKWEWPPAMPPASLASILELRLPAQKRQLEALNNTALQNLARGMEKIQTKKGKPLEEPWIIDLKNSESRGCSLSFGTLPTITHSHANHLWVTNVQDVLRPYELLAAQGFRRHEVPLPPGVRQEVLGSMAGNSFTVSVLERLFDTLLPSIGA